MLLSPSRRRALSAASRTSLTPALTALKDSNAAPTASASSRAIVVLPVPAGPQRMTEVSFRASTRALSAPLGPRRWSCPTTSSRLTGRSRLASGPRACRRSWSPSSNRSTVSDYGGDAADRREGRVPAVMSCRGHSGYSSVTRRSMRRETFERAASSFRRSSSRSRHKLVALGEQRFVRQAQTITIPLDPCPVGLPQLPGQIADEPALSRDLLAQLPGVVLRIKGPLSPRGLLLRRQRVPMRVRACASLRDRALSMIARAS